MLIWFSLLSCVIVDTLRNRHPEGHSVELCSCAFFNFFFFFFFCKCSNEIDHETRTVFQHLWYDSSTKFYQILQTHCTWCRLARYKADNALLTDVEIYGQFEDVETC